MPDPHEAISELEMQVDELRGAIQEVLGLHRKEGEYCRTCVGVIPGVWLATRTKVPYPCPTQQVLREALRRD